MVRLETTHPFTPPSVLRHRPIEASMAWTDEQPFVPTTPIPLVKRASRVRQPATPGEAQAPVGDRTEDSDDEHEDAATSPVSRRTAPPSTRSATHRPPATNTKRRARRVHPLVFLGGGMLIAVALLAALSVLVQWVAIGLDDLHYGRPRTFQVDAVVGHNDSQAAPSHFIALNLRGHIEIIEIPGGDVAHARLYLGPELYGPNADLVPVTLTFADVNGDHRPDMILHFQGTEVVFINDNGAFRPARPGELHQLNQ